MRCRKRGVAKGVHGGPVVEVQLHDDEGVVKGLFAAYDLNFHVHLVVFPGHRLNLTHNIILEAFSTTAGEDGGEERVRRG